MCFALAFIYARLYAVAEIVLKCFMVATLKLNFSEKKYRQFVFLSLKEVQVFACLAKVLPNQLHVERR